MPRDRLRRDDLGYRTFPRATAPETDRIKRVIEREGTTAESVKARIEKQWTDEQKMELASFIVKNDNTELIVPKLIELDKRFRSHG